MCRVVMSLWKISYLPVLELATYIPSSKANGEALFNPLEQRVIKLIK